MCGYSTFYLSICQLTGIWLLPLSYYEQCCHEHLCISFGADMFFPPLDYIIRSTIAGSCNSSVFNTLRNYFPKCLHDFYLPGVREGSSFNTSLICYFLPPTFLKLLKPKCSRNSQVSLGSTRGSRALFSLRMSGKISSGKLSPSLCSQPLPPPSPPHSLFFVPIFLSSSHQCLTFCVDHYPPPPLEYRPRHPQQCGPEKPLICLLHNESK